MTNESYLQRAAVPAASSDFELRILRAAQRMPQHISLGMWLRGLFNDFALPRPAYALASALLFGVMIGFGVPADISGTDDQSYSYEEGVML